jgi:hypothetical protein
VGDIIVDAKTTVYVVQGENGIAVHSAPTLAELTAAIRVSQWMTADGLPGFEANTEPVDAAGIESRHDDERAGRVNHKGAMLRIKRQTGTDIAYNTLVLGFLGFVVIRRYIDKATALAAGQEVGVYPFEAGETRHLPPEKNTMGRYEVPCFMRLAPTLRAIIAA